MRRSAADPLLIGGAKPNLGHSEAASGITSVIKATMMLEKSLIPPTIGVGKVKYDSRRYRPSRASRG